LPPDRPRLRGSAFSPTATLKVPVERKGITMRLRPDAERAVEGPAEKRVRVASGGVVVGVEVDTAEVGLARRGRG
jgi:hypothetical protein